MSAALPKIDYLTMGQWPMFVGFTTSPCAFKAEMKRLSIKNGPNFLVREDAAASTHFFDNPNFCIITMPKAGTRSKSQYAALVAHEALHVVQEMHSKLNKSAPFGNEADAYLLQSIVQQCLQIAFEEDLEIATHP